MKIKNQIIVFIITLLMFGAPLLANEAGAITKRMQDRLSMIDELKLAGEIGETNEGYIEVRTDVNAREQSMVQSENADRRALYEIVAKQTGQSVVEVGKQRAIRIAQQSKSGLWLQDASGKWYQKS